MGKSAERNPGTRIVTKIIFPVADMAAASDFYRALGFDVGSYDERYAWVKHRGEEVLHLATPDGFEASANRSAGYFHVQDADAWHRSWDVLGDVSVGPIEDRPWGMREFELRDPSGNLLRVGQNL